MNYEELSTVLKAISDPKRIKIIDLLSCGSLCACDVLDHFDFTQPTLSHHMKVLEKAGIVSVEKKSQWHYYTLKEDRVDSFRASLTELFASNETCICMKEESSID